MNGFQRNLSPFAVWGLSFGFAVGWGAFIMPGMAFLPSAGPFGTLIGILVGAFAMAIIGWNYHKMTLAFPGPSGACAFAARAFGADYGFLTAWSLLLSYMVILWVNASALDLLARFVFGGMLQFGWHSTRAEFDTYLGEVLFSVGVMVVAGLVCLWGRRLAGRVQAVLAAFMLVGVAACFFAALSHHEGGVAAMAPAFSSGGPGDKGMFRMSVKDTGCGISEEDLKKLAQPYVQVGETTAKRGGTGLGLHICRMLSRAMGGDMEIESELGKGSTFSVTIPAEMAVEEKPKKPNNPEISESATHRRILVAEDTKMNQMVLKTMFRRLGVTDVTFADNGCEAMGILTAPDAPKFDFVLTDAYMPVMTGMELVAAIRANPSVATMPVYLFTAEVEMKDAYAAAGFNGILLKPADLESLRKLIS